MFAARAEAAFAEIGGEFSRSHNLAGDAPAHLKIRSRGIRPRFIVPPSSCPMQYEILSSLFKTLGGGSPLFGSNSGCWSGSCAGLYRSGALWLAV